MQTELIKASRLNDLNCTKKRKARVTKNHQMAEYNRWVKELKKSR